MSEPIQRLVKPEDNQAATLLAIAFCEPAAHFLHGEIVLAHAMATASALADAARDSGLQFDSALTAYTQEYAGLMMHCIRQVAAGQAEHGNTTKIYTGK